MRRLALAPVCAFAFALTVVCGCTPAESGPAVVEGSAVEHGEALFRSPSVSPTPLNAYSCSTCHAAYPVDAGDAILPGAPLAGVLARSSYWGGQETELLRSVNHCLRFFMLKTEPWTPADVEARAVYAYLESLVGAGADAAPAPFTVVRDILDPPKGDPERGARTFGRACSSCHGAIRTGEGRLVQRALVLPDAWLANHPPELYTDIERRLVFVQKVRHGGFLGYGGEMPPFSAERLSDQDLGDLLAFLGVR